MLLALIVLSFCVHEMTTPVWAADNDEATDVRDFRLATNDTVLEVRRLGAQVCYTRLAAAKSSWNWIDGQVPFVPAVGRIAGGSTEPVAWKLVDVRKESQEEKAGKEDATQVVTAEFSADSPHLTMDVVWTSHPGPGPIEQVIHLTNRSDDSVMLGGMQSLVLRVSAPPNDRLQHWWVEKGGGRPTDFGTHCVDIEPGFHHRSASSPRSAKYESGEPIPWQCIQDTTSKQGLYTIICSSAHVAQQLDAKTDETLEITLGLDEKVSRLRTLLQPGETLEFPPVLIGCYRGSVDDACNRLHRWTERWNMPSTNDERLPLMDYSAWGIKFDVNEKSCRELIDEAAALGCEMFQVDAGWYRAVGWWREDTERFPHGLRAVSDYAHQRGLKFGLWVAWTQGGITGAGRESLNVFDPVMRNWFPEDVSDDWHPQPWIGKPVCLGSLQARKWCLDELRRIITQYKLDMLEHDQQMITWNCLRRDHDHTGSPLDAGLSAAEGYYEIYDTLRREFPELLFENCVNGGCTVDYGIMRRCHYVSMTDTYDPMSNRRAFYDASFPLPPRSLEAYVAAHPAATLDNLRYTLRSGMLGWCTLMIDTRNWTDEERAAARRQCDVYKERLRPLIRSGNLYHISDRPTPDGWDAFQYDAPQDGTGVILVFRANSKESKQAIHPRALDENATYRVTFEDDATHDVLMTGANLTSHGLSIVLPGEETSEIIYLQKQ